jgi:hypothetical protein
MADEPVVMIVDDDASIRQALWAFPGVTSAELQTRPISPGARLPMVPITANHDDGRRTGAARAVGYLREPFAEGQWLPDLSAAIHDDNSGEARR